MDLFIEWIELEQYQNEFYFVLRVQFDNRYIRNDELPNDVFNVWFPIKILGQLVRYFRAPP